jgi:hypothetical protein
VTDREHAAVLAVQSAAATALIDRTAAEPCFFDELLPADEPVLPRSDAAMMMSGCGGSCCSPIR